MSMAQSARHACLFMKTQKRLRFIEIGIFALVSSVFLNSAYQLFTDGGLLSPKNRRSPAGNEEVKGPRPASEAASAVIRKVPGLIPYETRCQPEGESLETT